MKKLPIYKWRNWNSSINSFLKLNFVNLIFKVELGNWLLGILLCKKQMVFHWHIYDNWINCLNIQVCSKMKMKHRNFHLNYITQLFLDKMLVVGLLLKWGHILMTIFSIRCLYLIQNVRVLNYCILYKCLVLYHIININYFDLINNYNQILKNNFLDIYYKYQKF